MPEQSEQQSHRPPKKERDRYKHMELDHAKMKLWHFRRWDQFDDERRLAHGGVTIVVDRVNRFIGFSICRKTDLFISKEGKNRAIDRVLGNDNAVLTGRLSLLEETVKDRDKLRNVVVGVAQMLAHSFNLGTIYADKPYQIVATNYLRLE